MENKTRQIMDSIKRLNDKHQAIAYIEKEHSILKKKLSSMNVKFYEERSQFPQDLLPNQSFNENEIVQVIKSYREINYILNGLTKEWITNVDEMQRFQEIQEEVENIILQYKFEMR